MNNEIGRKITSLTLMTIMIAGSLTFAIPGVTPEAFAVATQSNPHLFVSGEGHNSLNEVSPGNVIEIVVIDPLISDTDQGKGEPNVSLNGKKVRMAQATDGAWYAYVADRVSMQNMDAVLGNTNATAQALGLGLNVGVFCLNSASTPLGIDLSATTGYAVPRYLTSTGGATNNGTDGTTTLVACTAGAIPKASNLAGNPNSGAKVMNVIRENETLNSGVTATGPGQINFRHTNFWPFIQLFDVAENSNMNIVYNRAGGSEQVSLLLDDAVESKPVLDRTKYPLGADVIVTITDQGLNVDPTDEDTWVFGTSSSNKTIFYGVYDEDGAARAVNTVALKDASGIKSPTMGDPHFDELVAIKRSPQGTVQIDLQANEDYPITVITATGATKGSAVIGTGGQITAASFPVNFVETGGNSATFVNYGSGDSKANLIIASTAKRGQTFEIEYDSPGFVSGLVGHFFATIDMDGASVGDEWNSGERIAVTLTDNDANLNALTDEDLDVDNAAVKLIPSIKIGSPITLPTTTTASATLVTVNNGTSSSGQGETITTSSTVEAFSQRARTQITTCFNTTATFNAFDARSCNNFSPNFAVNYTFTGTTMNTLSDFLNNGTKNSIYHYFNYDIRSITAATNTTDIFHILIQNGTGGGSAGNVPVNITKSATSSAQGLIRLNAGGSAGTGGAVVGDSSIGGTGTLEVAFVFNQGATTIANSTALTAVVDFFKFGTDNDGIDFSDRYNNAIYRAELEETDDNTGVFVGDIEYIMLNQLNTNQSSTYESIRTISDNLQIIVNEDFTDEDSVRINYNDLGADGVTTQIADQQEAPSHSGVVSFDSNTYKIADTVTVTLEDQDLNTDTDTIEIYTVVSTITDAAFQAVGTGGYGTNSQGDAFGRLLDITFDDARWTTNPTNDGTATCAPTGDTGLVATGFTLVETTASSGVFTGDFQVPADYCNSDTTTASVTGTDMEVNYVDYRDASGEIIEVGDSAGIRANTGSVSLDRTVYPVPFGIPADFTVPTGTSDTNEFSIFPIHATGVSSLATQSPNSSASPAATPITKAGAFLNKGDLTIHVRVNDPDFDISASGEDKIQQSVSGKSGPVKITMSRAAEVLTLATAGNVTAQPGKITTGNTPVRVDTTAWNGPELRTSELGPITEIAPDAGIFELDFVIRYTDGPDSTICPTTSSFKHQTNGTRGGESMRFATASAAGQNYCILQGDIITVQYTDPTDASGDPNTVTDSATFDLRNGVLQSDKSVYIIGSDMILTVIEPDWDLDNDVAETYDLDLIEWDSDAATLSMGNAGGSAASFDPEPSDFRETGDSTGIFQIVIEIPEILAGDRLERGEEIVLEYTDWGPSGADYVGQEDEDINLTVFTSNFGATVELDQKVYTWTDKVYITIVAPDHNFDSDLIDEIGEKATDPIKVSTRGNSIDRYRLVETGTDTGIFTGEVILTGFVHDADGDGTNDITAPAKSSAGAGPTDGFLPADDDDGITVSFEFSEDETVVGSALIRWNIGEVQWLEASYPAKGTGVVRVVDPDMNLDPEAVDNFDVDVWSDSDAGGIDLTVTETNEATGIFEGTVFFTTTDESSGHRLRVSEGDTITAEYEDNTLPDPYTTADELDITGTSIIGTIVPPLERAPAANARVVDAFGNALSSVSVDQQVQVTADLANGQDREQSFAYIVQIQDGNGVTVSLSWIEGSLTAGQSFSPSQSWTPSASGTYEATIFVWESITNPTALSPPQTLSITVN
ncbi:MAG: hypothetical protein DWQ18_05560 [Crenarchaeota archaeon]|nr:MAG: hypothetical protein DWQ17_07575 [Thermoproteota archaeon]RDJ33517.1 MAG: hypothetical protein DWQ18_05560 [Thermoproteota archaeon]